MFYDPIFYYSQQSDDALYSYEPEGTPDVNRLLKSQPYWKMPLSSKELLPKTLILADWSALDWSYDKKEAVTEKLADLIAAGFSIYVWKNGNLEVLTDSDLYKLESEYYRVGLGLPPPDLKIVSQKLRTAEEQIHILDDYWVEYLKTGEKQALRGFPLNDFQKLDQHAKNQVLDHLDKANPKVDYILNNGGEAVIDFPPKLSDLEIKNSSTHLRIGELGQLSLEASREYLSLDLEEEVPAELLKSFLGDADIKNLKWENLSVEGDLPQKVSLNTLQTLCINDPIADPKLVGQLFSDSPQLKSLKLDQSYDLYENFPDSLDFPLLEDLSIQNQLHRMHAYLSRFLKNKSNLKYLDIFVANLPEAESSPDLSFPKLQTLRVRQSDISINWLEIFLEQAKDLRMLDLRYCNSLIGKKLKKDIQLPMLQELDMHGISSPLLLEQLCKAAPQLKKLSIEINDNTPIFGAHLMHNLKKLEHLVLASYVNFSSTSPCPSLKTLHTHLGNFDFVASKFTPNLEVIKLLGGELHGNAFNDLNSENVPHLKKLEFGNVKFWERSHIQTILQLSPPLVAIDFGYCDVSDCFALNRSYPHIEELNLKDARFESDDIKNILKNMPGLKKLTLPGKFKANAELQRLLADVPEVTYGYFLNFNISDEPQDTPFDSSSNLYTTPTAPDWQFKYEGNNHTKNQTMIIEKLSQYLIFKNKVYDGLLAKLHDGICNALSHLFLTLSLEDWDAIVLAVSKWDGSKEALDANPFLEDSLNKIWSEVEKYYLSFNSSTAIDYMGDCFPGYMQSLKSFSGGVIVSSPWHAIAIRYEQNSGMWSVYDPNFVDGYKICNDEELAQTIFKTMGSLIGIEGSFSLEPPLNAESFVANGGLLFLCIASNAKYLLSVLTKTPVTGEALQGILMRSTDGIPAWSVALHSSNFAIKKYVLGLLNEFIKSNPHDFKKQLEDSLTAVTGFKRQLILSDLLNMVTLPEKTKEDFRDILQEKDHRIKSYEKALETWSKEKPAFDTALSYYQHVLGSQQKKRLIEFKNASDVASFALGLEAYCAKTSREVFYIDSPAELVCSAPFMKRDGQVGFLQKGPGGALHDFLLKKHLGEDPVLIVNYDNFDAEDIVRFNSLLDDTRRADGTDLPENMQVIGLINPDKPDCYQGEDFYSRFDVAETCPLTSFILSCQKPVLPFEKGAAEAETFIIDLFHADDWEERLWGRWVIKKDEFFLKKGF